MEKLNDIVNIDIERIVVNPNQPRKVFDEKDLNELCNSIKSYGILQPITVIERNESYELVMGERRFRASKLAGLKKIPAIIVDIEENDSAVVALIENVQRRDLNFVEEAYSYSQLANKFGFSQDEIAKRVGKKQSTISNKMRILNLGNPVLDILLDNGLTERHGRALLKIKNEEKRVNIANHIAKKALNVKDSEKYIESFLVNSRKRKIKLGGTLDYKIYLNTIKNAYKSIVDTGIDVEYQENDQDEYVEIVVRIPKG